MTTPSAEITEKCTDTLLNFHKFLVSRTKFSYLVIFSASVFGRLWVKRTAVSITCCFIFSVAGLS